MDVSGNVVTADDYLSSLKVSVSYSEHHRVLENESNGCVSGNVVTADDYLSSLKVSVSYSEHHHVLENESNGRQWERGYSRRLSVFTQGQCVI